MRNTNPTLADLLDRLDDLVDGTDLCRGYRLERTTFGAEVNYSIGVTLAQPVAHPRVIVGSIHGSHWIEVEAPTRERVLAKAIDALEDVIATGKRGAA